MTGRWAKRSGRNLSDRKTSSLFRVEGVETGPFTMCQKAQERPYGVGTGTNHLPDPLRIVDCRRRGSGRDGRILR